MPARYLNVDLEIESPGSIAGLIQDLSKDALVLHHATHGRVWFASLELLSQRPRTPEQAIQSFCRLLRALSPAARRVWSAAKRRTFNIGIQGGIQRGSLELRVSRRTLEAVADLGAELAITVYGS